LYSAAFASKNKNNVESIEQMIMAFSNSINRQLSNISATLTSQISDLTTKLDNHTQRTNDIQCQIQDAIIPAIHKMARIIDVLAQQNTFQQNLNKDTASSCSEKIQLVLNMYLLICIANTFMC
jgi:t-SNARE complex subunit (syntaxin)